MKQAYPNTCGILVSDEVAKEYGPAIFSAYDDPNQPIELLIVDGDKALTSDQTDRARVALLSVDVMGSSTRSYDDPKLKHFSEIVLRAPNLEWLQICASGVDRALYSALHQKGVRLTNAAGVNAASVAQTALAGMLALVRNVPAWIEAQKQQKWQPLRGPLVPDDLSERRAVVVGTGAIGRSIGQALRALGMHVTGVRRTQGDLPEFSALRTFEELDQVLPNADWLILACPLTSTTHHLIDARRLSLLSPAAYLVNVARGSVIHEPSLIDALFARRLAGAYLDVFESEPLPETSPLWDMQGVLISSHSAGSFARHQQRLLALFIKNLAQFCVDLPLFNETVPTA
jgi:D-2-hydroxyacid dehydrogenase (NADP+)